MNIVADFLAMQDVDYRDFQSSLIPTIPKDSIIGVRMPQLRKYAKALTKTEREAFLQDLPHVYYEENMLHALLLSEEKDYSIALAFTETFLPYIDNWAICDTFFPRILESDTAKLYSMIEKWINSPHIYTCRFAIGLLMRCFLEDTFSIESMHLVAGVKRTEYYIEMMVAWYFATALAKQYDSTIVFLEERRLTPSIHRKTIQKALESYRISDDIKLYVRTLR